MTCSVESCDRTVYARGLCQPHYKRLRRHGDVLADVPVGRGTRECSVDGCIRPAEARRLCHGHYLRWKRTGDVGEEAPLERATRPLCAAMDCGRPAHARGLCGTHYKRAVRHGDIEAGGAIRIVTGDGWMSHGYWYVMVPVDLRHFTNGESQVAEHRLVMAQHLGRSLYPGEVVHHINGDRTDNRIENLELWSTTQPKGQRVDDKVAFAVAMLRQYAPEMLAESGERGAGRTRASQADQ